MSTGVIIVDEKKLPTCPPQVHIVEVNHGRGAISDDSDLESQDGAKMPATAKVPWWRRYYGYQSLRTIPHSRTRRRILLSSVFVAAAIVALLVGLYESGHLNTRSFTMKSSSSVRLPQGTYLGGMNPKSDKYPRAVESFRGIPYAQSTSGNNRFRAPQPLANDTPDVINSALEFGDVCPQGGNRDQGEDCLNLNLYRPYFGDDAAADSLDMAKLGGDGTPLPVIIYVHGGGFNGGSGRERNMGSFVAFAETPIIGISFNYRVGALGFPSGAVSASAGALNLGLKDQQMLFSWVQKNVASFGGNPDNVTIMGLSAGAHSVGHQLTSYAPANKLTSDPVPFHGAILESGGSTARAVLAATHPLYESQFQEFLSKCGLENTPKDAVFSKLRDLPIDTIVAASRAVWGKYYGSLRWAFQPVVDGPGGIIPDLPIRSWEKGNVLRIPILTGFNTNEGAGFVPAKASNPSALRDLMSPLIPALNETDLTTMEALYPDPTTTEGLKMYITQPPSGFGKQFWRLDDAYAHYAYICPVFQTGHYASATDAPVYVYHFAARSGAHGGADHGDEAPIVTHDMASIAGMTGLIETADAMTGAWSRFVAFGNPNPSTPKANELTWQRFFSPLEGAAGSNAANTTEKGQVALFGSGNDEKVGLSGRQHEGVPAQMTTMTDREKDECRFWWDRVIYSEGFGTGSVALTRRDVEFRSKL